MPGQQRQCGALQVLSAGKGGSALTAWSVARSLFQREGALSQPWTLSCMRINHTALVSCLLLEHVPLLGRVPRNYSRSLHQAFPDSGRLVDYTVHSPVTLAARRSQPRCLLVPVQQPYSLLPMHEFLFAGLRGFAGGNAARVAQLAAGAAISWVTYEEVKLRLAGV